MEVDIENIRRLLIEKITGRISEEDNVFVEQLIQRNEQVNQIWQELNSARSKAFINQLDEELAWEEVSNKFERNKNSSSNNSLSC